MTFPAADYITNASRTESQVKTSLEDWLAASKKADRLNYGFNTSFEVWGAGTSAAPTGWTLTGAGATVAKNTTASQFKLGSASVAITRVGTDCYLAQTPSSFAGFNPVGWWQGVQVTLGYWVRATVASRARIAIYDGVGTTYSSYHTGGSSFEFLKVTRTLDAAATEVTVRLYVDTGDTTAQFDGGILVLGPDVDDWRPDGWRGRKAILQFGHSLATSALSTSTTYYLSSASANTTENDVESPVPFKGVARNLQVSVGTTPTGSNTDVFTLRKNAADTSLTTTVTSAGQTAADNTNEVAFAKGDIVNLKIAVGSTGTTGAHGMVEYEEIP